MAEAGLIAFQIAEVSDAVVTSICVLTLVVAVSLFIWRN